MIKIPFNGKYIECSTAAEAIEVLKHLSSEESKKIQHQSPLLAAIAPSSAIGSYIAF